MVYPMTLCERTCHEDLRTEKILTFVEFWICAIFSNKWREIQNSMHHNFWVVQHFSEMFLVLRSSWHVPSETVIEYTCTIILKIFLAANEWRHFPTKNAKIWKKAKENFLENDEFYNVKFQLHCIKTEKVEMIDFGQKSHKKSPAWVVYKEAKIAFCLQKRETVMSNNQ